VVPADSGLHIVFKLVEGNADALPMRFSHALVAANKRGERDRFGRLPAWNPFAWAMAGTLCWAISWAWTCIPSPAAVSNYWIGMWSAAGPVAPAGAVPRRKKTPDLIAVLHCLLEHDTAGDPMTGLRWSEDQIMSSRAANACGPKRAGS
jgi:hypothetical protein